MKISTKGRYALRLMLDLAVYNTGEYVALQETATRQGIAVKYLEQIAHALNRAGFLRSTRGKSGGYMLVKKPAECRVGDILRAMEGSMTLDAGNEKGADASTAAVLTSFWQGLNQTLDGYMDSVTLEDLHDHYKTVSAVNYSI